MRNEGFRLTPDAVSRSRLGALTFRLMFVVLLLLPLVACGGSKQSNPTDALTDALTDEVSNDLQSDVGGDEDIQTARDVWDVSQDDATPFDSGNDELTETDVAPLPVCRWDRSTWDKCVLGQ